jgi:glycosyltransferase involved in cell wall biosynthesis
MKLASGGDIDPVVIAMDRDGELECGGSVKRTIRKDVKYDYIRAADYINLSDIDVVSVQHEFGLFGGAAGSYLSLLLERVNKPLVTTLHTVLNKPSVEYFDSMSDVCNASDKVVVMNRHGIKMLKDVYSVPESKIELIPHGIPDLPFVHSDKYKASLGMAGRKTILTSGLLGRNKGIEVMLRALPAIVKADPSILYVVLGATHPEVVRAEGQAYKLGLEKMVVDLGLERNVIFGNRFVSDEELVQYLGAADIYVTPYLHQEQLTSGTLAFAVGAGRAVVSTPYWAACELLADGRGRLVRFGDHEHLARSVLGILEDDRAYSRMKERAYEYGRSMVWPRVGRLYRNLLSAQLPSGPARLDRGAESRAWTRAWRFRDQVSQSA